VALRREAERPEEGQAAPVYVLYGPEVLLKERFVQGLLARLLPPGLRDLNLEVLHGDAADPGDLAARCRTLPAFAPRRVVLVRGAERLPAPAWSALEAALQPPPESTCLLLLLATPRDRLEGPPKRFAESVPGAVALAFAPLREGEARTWLREEARRLGTRLTPDAAGLLVSLLGPDAQRLAAELEKLTLFVGEGEAIAAATVEALVGEERVRRIFELADAVASRELEAALHLSRRLLTLGESPLALLGMLARQFRLLLRAREGLAAGKRGAELARELGLQSFLGARLEAQARQVSPAWLEQGLTRLARLDGELKGGRRDGVLSLDLAVLELCR
jgi:DNA polymerase-3 subunit delta